MEINIHNNLSLCKLFRNLLLIIAGLFFSTYINAEGSSATQAKQENSHWYDNFLFKDPELNFQFIRTLGYSYSQGADLGECVSTAKRITLPDINAWYREWLSTADRLNQFAQEQEDLGSVISAREAYFRASNYYRTASFFMDSPADRNKGIEAWKKSRESFLKAIASLPHIQFVRIPYENTQLPGYFISGKPGNPLLIVHSGFDGTAEELYFEVGMAALTRGYNVLLFEGPGQGEMIKLQNLPFRYDWEKVVSPVIDFAEKQPGIDKDKIALLGISMGGYFAPRACAFETRLKACIANGGVYDLYQAINKKFPADIQQLITTDPKQYNQIIANEVMKTSIGVQWFFNNGMWTFGVNTPAELFEKLKPFNLRDVAPNIKQPILVIDSEDDHMLEGQANQLFAAIGSNQKNFYLFTAKTTGEAHCQMGAIAISNEIIFDWLDKQFKK